MDTLGVREYSGATVYPTIRVGTLPDRLLMGVFDADGSYIERTALERRSGEVGAPAPREIFPAPRPAGDRGAIYGGTLYFHFGHFLLESLARLWHAADEPNMPVVWAGSHSWEGKEFEPWQLEILQILGVRNELRILSAPETFERLVIPDVGYRYDDWFHPQHAEFLGRYVGPPQETGRKIWLSRTGMSNGVKDVNAPAVERRLAAEGWAITYPERSSVRAQLDEISRASVIAGEEGSAFHALMLLQDVSGKRFEIIKRHGMEHRNLHTIGDARSVRQRFHTNREAKLLFAEGRRVAKISPNASSVLDALEVPVREVPMSGREQDLALGVAAIADAANASSLVEIGSRFPLLALVNAPHRVLVSSELRPDPRQFPGLACYETDLESYLAYFSGLPDPTGASAESPAPALTPADVIVLASDAIDAALEAFERSGCLSHSRTVWVFTGDVDHTAVAARLASRAPGAWAVGARVNPTMLVAAAALPEPKALTRLRSCGIGIVPVVDPRTAIRALRVDVTAVERPVVAATVAHARKSLAQAARVIAGLALRTLFRVIAHLRR